MFGSLPSRYRSGVRKMAREPEASQALQPPPHRNSKAVGDGVPTFVGGSSGVDAGRAYEALTLQRLVGNRAVGALLRGHSSSRVAQRMRAPQAGEEKLVAAYKESLQSGLRNKARLKAWLEKAPDAAAAGSTSGTKEKVEAAGYKTFWFNRGDQIVVSTIRGRACSGLISGRREGYKIPEARLFDDQDYFYSNSFDPKTGRFHASVNYQNADADLAKEEGLPPPLNNSEIIWYQRSIAASAWQQIQEGQGMASSEVLGASQIRSISREEVSNKQTLRTIKLCDAGEEAGEARTIRFSGADAAEDGWALLGTPNGTSSVWLLLQHGHEAGLKGIESVTYSKDNLVITYAT